MKESSIQIYNKEEYHWPTKGGFIPTLHFYLHDDNKKHDGIIICPGGGYSHVSESEGGIVAKEFYNRGYNTFVLTYSIKFLQDQPLELQPLKDITRAIRIVKANADEFNVNANNLTVMGFSAGGHLVGSLLENYDAKDVEDDVFDISARPARAILCYPVITLMEKTHQGTKENLVGNNSELQHRFSLEEHVHKDMPPVFIWTTKTDNAVPYENTILFKEACDKNDVPCYMKIYENGPHGLSLANRDWALGNYGEPYTQEQIITEICYAIETNSQSQLPSPLNEAKTVNDIPYVFARWRNKSYDESKKNDDVATWVDVADDFIQNSVLKLPFAITNEELENQTFIKDSHLLNWPAKQKNKYIVAIVLANNFNPTNIYTEKQITEHLASYYDDPIMLRRYLVDYHFLIRDSYGKEYRINHYHPYIKK